MKKIFYLLLYSSLSFSQFKNGIIEYKVIGVNEKLLSIKSDFIQKNIDYSKKINYKLSFNENYSVFEISDNSPLNILDSKYFSLKKRMLGVFYENLSKKNINIFRDDLFLGKVNIDIPYSLKWELFNESKEIYGYTCYLAKSLITEFEMPDEKYEITAWYCPKIPISIGPKNYFGLPGLIMELTNMKETFGVSKMEFENNPIIDISKNKGYRNISTQEYYKKISEEVEYLKNSE